MRVFGWLAFMLVVFVGWASPAQAKPVRERVSDIKKIERRLGQIVAKIDRHAVPRSLRFTGGAVYDGKKPTTVEHGYSEKGRFTGQFVYETQGMSASSATKKLSGILLQGTFKKGKNGQSYISIPRALKTPEGKIPNVLATHRLKALLESL